MKNDIKFCSILSLLILTNSCDFNTETKNEIIKVKIQLENEKKVNNNIITSEKMEYNVSEVDCDFPKYCVKKFNRFGFSINSNFILDKLKSYDFDKNGVKDSIAIFSPWELNSEYDLCPKRSIDSVENRLLVINLYDNEGKVIQKFKFDNVISKDKTYPIYSGSEYIKFNENYKGFILNKSMGQGYKNEYSIFCNYDVILNDFFIDSILFEGNRPLDGKDINKKIDYKSKKVFLKSFNRSLIEKEIENF